MNSLRQFSILTSPDRVRGFVFDLAVLAGNIVFSVSILDRSENLSDRNIGFLLLAAMTTQLLGAVLKSRPLQYRLSGKSPRQTDDLLDKFMGVLLFFHFILFTIICLMSLGLLGIVDLVDRTSSGDDLWVGVSLLIAGLLTYAVWRAGKRPEKVPTKTIKYPIAQEALADGLLWISVGIVTRFFWETWYLEIEPSRGIGISLRAIVLLVSLSLLFVVFYMPSRYLFLVEDYRYGRTWVRMWVAMLPLVWLVLIG
jgi:magnesium-transporting ATPase (P-type)